jgi:hypothetical protein
MMSMRREIAVACLLLCAACEASIDGGTRSSVTTDANGNSDSTTQQPDASPVCASRTVYLNFNGQTLNDAAASDATLDRASWLNTASGTATPFQQGNANRAQIIADITQGVKDALAQQVGPVNVVTTRPTTGPYVMIVYGGNSTDVGSNYGFAVNELDCNESEKSDVAWISNNYTTTLRHVNTTIGAIGFGLGLTATNDVNDCMCGWANGCQKDHTKPCVLNTNIARDPAATDASQRGGRAPEGLPAFAPPVGERRVVGHAGGSFCRT